MKLLIASDIHGADVGIAGGNGEGLLIKKGEVIRKVPEDQLLDTLRYELEHWGE